MSDSDDSLDLLVRLKGDVSGAGAVKDALAGVAGEATAAGAAVGKSAGAHDEAGKAAQKHGGHLEAMRKICHSLNQVVPGLGVLMQAAFSPVGAAISVAVMALQGFREHMRKVNEEMKRMEDENAKPLTRRIEAMREGTVSLAAAQAELRERLEHTAHSERGVREEIEKTLEAQKRQIELERSKADADKDKELAGLEALHGAGLLSDERYYAAKLAAEEKYRKKKRELEEAEEMRGILAQRRVLELAELNQPALQAGAEEAVKKREKAAENLASFDRAGVEQRAKESKKLLDEFEDKAGDKRIMAFERAGGVHATRQTLYGALQEDQPWATSAARFGGVVEQMEKWQKLKWDAEQNRADSKVAPAEEARLKVEEEKAKGRAERAVKKAEENQDLINEYRRTLPEKRGAFDQRQSANMDADQAANDAARERMKGTAGGAAVAGGAQALQRLMQGGKWDLKTEGDVGEMNGLLSLARMLGAQPAHERGQHEVPNRTGVNFARAADRTFQESERDMLRQGGEVSAVSRQAHAETVRLLSSLHGDQAATLQTIAKWATITEQLLKVQQQMQKRADDMQRQIQSRGLNAGG